jgi:1,4-dihydroxy-2-naphthoyl-CoA hydrolase
VSQRTNDGAISMSWKRNCLLTGTGTRPAAANGFLHAGSIVTLADTSCGYGCFANLPQGATGFTTIELKSNHLGTAREGTIASFARALHMGRNTHVWDAVISHKESNRTIALFRCTQMILYPK